jgi:hypothetical protein
MKLVKLNLGILLIFLSSLASISDAQGKLKDYIKKLKSINILKMQF